MQNHINYKRTFETADGGFMHIAWDDQDLSDEGLAFFFAPAPDAELEHESGEIDDLADLCAALNMSKPRDVQDLPTFGGREPRSTDGVFSWSHTALLVQVGSDWVITPR